ncbi:hypothetical protein CFP56_025618 [Quercus suber]|uniref:Reverse transcriptase zinc-binding domain-containing protein n=1 Tax=Quercus suber TaxID=58331 RepID=A0AAW0K3L0_QUESU
MEWKAERVQGCFIEEDADAILSIPLSLHRPKDRLIWVESPSGKFMVKSAYRLAYEVNRGGGNADCSNPSARKKVWKGLWRMNLPHKVKHFSWKAARNILASKEALRQRHIVVDGGYALCGNPTENVLYVLWFCDHAKDVWNTTAPSSLILFIVDGILQQASCFRSCCFTHTKRQGNVPAHMLAQYSKPLASYVAWVESCPSHIERACAQDMDLCSSATQGYCTCGSDSWSM